MKLSFNKLHITWFLIWLPIFVLMVMPFMQAGHPPIIVFSPFAIGVGFLGHLFVLLMQFVYSRSNKNIASISDTPIQDNWPWQVILLLVIFSFMAIGTLQSMISFSQSVSFGLLGNTILLLNILLPSAGLVALLKRKPGGFKFIQGMCITLIILLLVYMFVVLTYRHIPTDFIILPVAAIIIGVYLYFFSKSEKVKLFFRVSK